jgi:hypothetical protein
MSFAAYLLKRIIQLLNDRRIVVWYDAEGDFGNLIRSGQSGLSNTDIIDTRESLLEARRRGVTEEEEMRDPFEVFALAGSLFGDTEDQKMESLARQAMPQKSDEITRLSHEGKPTISLLDALEKTHRWPLLNDVFRRETPAEVIALAHGREDLYEGESRQATEKRGRRGQ